MHAVERIVVNEPLIAAYQAASSPHSIRALKSDDYRTDWDSYSENEGTGTATLGDHFRNR